MKRHFVQIALFAVLTFFAAVFSSCADTVGLVGDYFPFRNDVLLEYEGEGNEYASFSSVTEFLRGNVLQQRINNGGTEVVRLYKNQDNRINRIYSAEEFYNRVDLTEGRYEAGSTVLAGPLKKGTSWASEAGSSVITDINVKLSLPAGDFEALEVTTSGDGFIIKDYYSKGVGLVMSEFSSEGSVVTSRLKSIKLNEPVRKTVRFYYPNLEEDKLYYVERELSLFTGDRLEDALASEYVKLPAGLNPVFPDSAKINSITLEGDRVKLDLSPGFLSEMNAGSGYEALILDSVANTFGHLYFVSEVELTIDGEPYQSGHFEFAQGEALKPDLSKGEEIFEA